MMDSYPFPCCPPAVLVQGIHSSLKVMAHQLGVSLGLGLGLGFGQRRDNILKIDLLRLYVLSLFICSSGSSVNHRFHY